MNLVINDATKAISEQQKGKEHTAVYMVGEQLKDIIADNKHFAELVLQDLQNPDMSLSKCEAKIKARADELHKKHGGNSSCVNPKDAEDIIREFYGLHESGESTPPAAARDNKIVSLAELL